jgi:hypothetical protein
MSFAFWRKACLYRAETLRHSSPIRIKFFVWNSLFLLDLVDGVMSLLQHNESGDLGPVLKSNIAIVCISACHGIAVSLLNYN